MSLPVTHLMSHNYLKESSRMIGRVRGVRSTRETSVIVGSLLPRWFVENCFEADLTDGELIGAWLQTLCNEAKDQLLANIIPISILLTIGEVVVTCAALVYSETDLDYNFTFHNHLRDFTIENL